MTSPLATLAAEIRRILVGQEEMLTKILIGLLARGHLLIEGIPGLAKTLTLKTLAQALDVSFKRIQFTPDLLPADLVGTRAYNQKSAEFFTVKGPIFAHLLLADEINRAPAKVQSALLEAMQELQVTIGPDTFPLPRPFLVMATQNPIESEGVYQLPEAQIDRFMLKVIVTYPTKEEEQEIITRMAGAPPAEVKPVVSLDEVVKAQEEVERVYVDEKIKGYVVEIVAGTRNPGRFNPDFARWVDYGASPRGSLFLTRGAKATAYLAGRDFVLPEDVKRIAPDVLRHRLILSYEAQAEEVPTDRILTEILARVPVP